MIDNKKCQLSCSPGHLNPGFLTNTFYLSWESVLLHAFPPILIIPQVILKMKLDCAKLILVAPSWPKQCWFSDLLALSVQPPIFLPFHPDLLTQHHIQVCFQRSAPCISQHG